MFRYLARYVKTIVVLVFPCGEKSYYQLLIIKILGTTVGATLAIHSG